MIGNPTGSVAGPAAWMPEATDRPEPPGAATWWGGGVGAAGTVGGAAPPMTVTPETVK